MEKLESYENFPLWIPFITIIISINGYILGAFILSGFGCLIVILYLIYCISIELLVIFRSCRDCYYYGKICGLGKGKIAPLFTKKGKSGRFIEKKISWYDLIPDFFVVVIPIIGGIILLFYDFSFVLLGLIILLVIIFFGGTGFIRGSFACKYCKQKELGCPAQNIFNK
ncbi:MAG: hypothetical protein LN408_00155 [Candidatus Thermoplasmatota archaeon]|nr:hypothetical protein [Candidatus Thermoplasmatota archaeon]